MQRIVLLFFIYYSIPFKSIGQINSETAVCFVSSIESVKEFEQEDLMLSQFSNELLRTKYVNLNGYEEVYIDEITKNELLKLIVTAENAGILSSKSINERCAELLSHFSQDKLIVIFSRGNLRKTIYKKAAQQPGFTIPIPLYGFAPGLIIVNLTFFQVMSQKFTSKVLPAYHQLHYLELNLKTNKVEKLISQSFNRSPLNDNTLDEAFDKINAIHSKR